MNYFSDVARPLEPVDHLTNEDPGTTPGQVTPEDYDFWKSNFGNVVAGDWAGSDASAHFAPGDSPGANFAVPEPATCMSLFAAAILLISVR